MISLIILSKNDTCFACSIVRRYFSSIFRNPTKGIIINHPNGSDVYSGVPHDYTGLVGQIDFDGWID